MTRGSSYMVSQRGTRVAKGDGKLQAAERGITAVEERGKRGAGPIG